MRGRPANFNDILWSRAQHAPEQKAFIFLKNGEDDPVAWTYGELFSRARSLATVLQKEGAGGERALLLYQPGLDFIAALLGCFHAGVIAVPVYPVHSKRHLSRLKSVVQDSQAKLILAIQEMLPRLRMLTAGDSLLSSMQYLATDNVADNGAHEWRAPKIDRHSIALLQYTSGSTGNPKGVVLSHGNLLDNEARIQKAFCQSDQSVIVGWLPLYHDMGLIGNVLQTLYLGTHCILMPPTSFLQRPFRWLSAISRYRAATSGGPNFAYDLCVRKITSEEKSQLDLSTWTVAFNGAEPVRASTLKRFAAGFADVGFKPEAFVPCYGLAEATLLVSGKASHQAPFVAELDANALEQNRANTPASHTGSKHIVACSNVPSINMAIVDPESGTLCRNDTIGEIWVSSRGVGKGYWNRAQESREVFHARIEGIKGRRFLRTGDLGFVRDGRLFVTGRLKDLIIIRGRNHYPHDIEATAEAVAGSVARAGSAAAFMAGDHPEERLVIVQELAGGEDPGGVAREIYNAVLDQHQLEAQDIVLVRTGTLSRTSSGKIQRHACRTRFLGDDLRPVAHQRFTSGAEFTGLRPMAKETAPAAGTTLQWLMIRLAAYAGVEPKLVRACEPVSHYGLDSLKAMEFVHAIEDDLGKVVSLYNLLGDTTILELAEVLDRSQGLSGKVQESALPDPKTFPLSEGQRSLWFLHCLAPQSTAYNMAFAAWVPDGLDAGILHYVLQSLTDRHPSLRTTFHSTDGQPFQTVRDAVHVGFHTEDATSWSDQQLKARLEQEATRTFNLEDGPIFFVVMFRRESGVVISMAVHHIIADLWSMALLMEEMTLLYSARSRNEPLELPRIGGSYYDYVLWQQEMLSGLRASHSYSYWSSQLGGELPVLNLPTDHPRRQLQTYEGAARSFRLGTELTQKIKQLALKKGTTPYTILLAILQALLFRYTGQQDILVGSPTTGRSRTHWERTFGYFVNPVTIRAFPRLETRFAEFLESTRRTVLQALEHQDYPFVSLVQKLQPERDPSRSPLFQVMFAFEKTFFLEKEGISIFALGQSDVNLQLNGIVMEPVAFEHRIALFDLLLTMAEAHGSFDGALQYNSGLFEASTIGRMKDHFLRLSEQLLENPEVRLSEPCLLTEAETEQVLSQWQGSGTRACGGNLHERFAAQAAQTPGSRAVSCAGQHLTYFELDDRASRLAGCLQRLGAGTETRVALCFQRSVEMIVALLGVLKAGGTYVPLDPDYPPERLSYMLEDSNALLLITGPGIEWQGVYRGGVLSWEAALEEMAHTNSQQSAVNVLLENAAYVMYTSGSTGQPKGVIVTHGNVLRLMDCTERWFGIHSGEVVALFHSVAFDVSVWEIWRALLYGGRLVVVSYWVSRSPDDFLKLLADEEVTVLAQTPSAFQQLMRAEEFYVASWDGEKKVGESGEEQSRPLKLRVVVFAGEALAYETLLPWMERHPEQPQLVNMYGITETTVYSSWRPIRRSDVENQDGRSNIGIPLPNLQIYVLDEWLQPLPVGIPGELFVGGAGVARGYLNRAELTADRFVPNPWAQQPGERMYRSGDRGCWRADGSIDYLGRLDQQIKLRGFRIEPGEIESVLTKHPQVSQAFVVAREDTPGDKRLVAYVIRTSQESGPEQDLQLRRWQEVFENLYDPHSSARPELTGHFNIVGWNSTYTGDPIPAEEMRLWVEETVTRIHALNPKRVLEVGCGTGLLLTRLAKDCDLYVGLDFSSQVLDSLKKYVAVHEDLRHVELRQGLAHDLRFAENNSMDLVIINSVAQYFPHVDYLVQALKEALRVTREGGHVFIGDVRSLILAEAYYASAQLHRQPAEMPLRELRQGVWRLERAEEELLVDPALFEELHRRWPKIGRSKITIKTAPYDNELSRFRYDVTLTIGDKETLSEADQFLEWDRQGNWKKQLQEAIASQRHGSIKVRGLRDKRTAPFVEAARLLRNGSDAAMTVERLQIVSAEAGGEDPHRVEELARRLGVEFCWQGFSKEGIYDVVFNPVWTSVQTSGEWQAGLDFRRYANEPTHPDAAAKLSRALHLYLARVLPHHMLPSTILVLTSLPLTSSGKVDRRALPAPDYTPGDNRNNAAESPLEEILKGIWCEVLKLPRVDMEASFFDLGGHSLLATRVISRIRSVLEIEIPLSWLFTVSGIRQLAARIEAEQQLRQGVKAPPLTAQPRGESAPLSFAQQRLWFFAELQPGSPAYNINGAVRLRGDLQVIALEDALKKIVARHEALRTRCVVVDGTPMQTVRSAAEFDLLQEDLGRWKEAEEDERDSEILSRLRAEALRPYDLQSDFLFRALLLRLSSQEHILLLGMHHIVSDGWSLGVLVRELVAHYEALANGVASHLPSLKIQYADFAQWQREWLKGEVLNQHLTYWRRQLRGMATALKLSFDPSRSGATLHVREKSFEVPADVTQLLDALGRERSCTWFMVLLTAFQILLHYQTKEDDIFTGTNVANRSHEETESLIGCFVNQLVLRTSLSGDPTLPELIARVRTTVLEAYLHQDLPFEQLVADLQPKRTTETSSLFNTKFECSPGLYDLPRFTNLDSSLIDLKLIFPRHDLHLFVDSVTPTVAGRMVYSTQLFEERRIAQMLEQYAGILSLMATQPEIRLGEIIASLDTDSERERILAAKKFADWERGRLGRVRRKATAAVLDGD